MFRPELKMTTTLPQKIKKEPYIPSDDDIKRILKDAEGSLYEIAVLLACYGLRRSEICALTPDDIEGNVITRDVIILDSIVEKINRQGYIYKGHPSNISDYLSRTQEKLDIPHFSVHKLRHYFASKLSSMNIPEADIMKMGGLETDYVMKNVYRHAMKEKTKALKEDASKKLADVLLS